ncbi:DUF2570 domain-containing protein [Erwinia sp. E602]|uniref:DUF2570 domain-containing protein n=1 Tax=Erwinia sp. E602 TaxID=2675378 RepID=UPI001BEDA634|nr:DUF2570 domain-containing protein [Erwinia sp. E602]QUG76371.1 DUF2570 domain-containing protein [Erwinia sp. E602]
MRALGALCIVLFVLMAAATAGMVWERQQRAAAEKQLTTARGELKQTGDILAEVRALRRDVSEIEAGVKALGQKRNATGETRRENIKTALAGDQCAAAPVPAAVADSLYRRAAEVSAANYSGAFARKPDGKN